MALERLDREGPAPSNYGIGSAGQGLNFCGHGGLRLRGDRVDRRAGLRRDGARAPRVVGVCGCWRDGGRRISLCFVWHRLFFRIWGAVDVIVAESLPQTWWPGGLVRLAYVLVVLVTFPLQLFPVSDLVSRAAARVVECAAAARARRRAGVARVRVPAPPRPRRVAVRGPGLRAAGARRGAVGAPDRRGDAARAPARPGVHLRRVADLRRGDGERAGDVAGRGVVIRFVLFYWRWLLCGDLPSIIAVAIGTRTTLVWLVVDHADRKKTASPCVRKMVASYSY